MKGSLGFGIVVALFVAAFIKLAIPPRTPPPNANPTNAGPSFVYTDPRTNQQITIINDGTENSPYLGEAEITRRLRALPANHLKGIQTLHGSLVLQEIIHNVYQNLSPSDRATWESLATRKDLTAEVQFGDAYIYYFLAPPSEYTLNEVVHSLRAGDSNRVSQFFFMASLFVDPTKHEIVFYQGTQQYQPFTYIPEPLPYSVQGNVLTIGKYQFALRNVNGATSITGLPPRTFVKPVALPEIFVRNAALPAVSSVPGGSSTLSLGNVMIPQSKGAYYVSPNPPTFYRSPNSVEAADALAAEIHQLQTTPPEDVSQINPGAIPHGFSVTPQ